MSEKTANKKFSIIDIRNAILRRSDSSTIIAAIVLLIAFSIGNKSFLSEVNIFNLSRTAALYFFVGLGQVFCQVQGGINLALGFVGCLSIVSFGIAVDTYGVNPWIGFLLMLIIGTVLGLINGFIMMRLHLAAFVVTLSTSYIFQGLSLGLTKGYPFTNIPDWVTGLGRGGIGPISYLFIVMVIALLLLAYFFKYTVTGRQILATGSNEVAARLSGVKTGKISMLCQILSGFFAALAGCFWISRLGSASPQTGSDWMMISFAGAILGGTAPGVLRPVGLFFAAILFTMIKNGLTLLGVDVYYEQCFLGAIILFAVCFESFRSSYVARKRI